MTAREEWKERMHALYAVAMTLLFQRNEARTPEDDPYKNLQIEGYHNYQNREQQVLSYMGSKYGRVWVNVEAGRWREVIDDGMDLMNYTAILVDMAKEKLLEGKKVGD